MLWPPDANSWLIGRDPDTGKDWRQEKGTTEEKAGWMAVLTRWTRIWASSLSWWWTGKPGMLQSMGSQRVGHNWVTKQQQNKVQVYYILAVLYPSFPNVHCIETSVSYSCLLLLLLFLVDVKSGHHGSILTRNRSWFNRIVGECCSFKIKIYDYG